MTRRMMTSGLLMIGIIVLGLFMYIGATKKGYVDPKHIEIDHIDFENGEWIVNGTLTHEEEKALFFNKGFNGFEYYEENGNGYLKLSYGIVSGKPAKTFSLFLTEDLNQIKSLYLVGNLPEDMKLIEI